jgi:hypothetical protein
MLFLQNVSLCLKYINSVLAFKGVFYGYPFNSSSCKIGYSNYL